MECIGNKIVVTVDELTSQEGGEQVMTYSNYHKMVVRKNITVVRPGKGLDHPALIDYSSLPSRFRAKFIAKYGDPETMLREDNDRLSLSDEARDYYDSYVLEDGTHLKSCVIEEYTVNASVLDRLVGMCNTQRSRRNMSGNRTPLCWDAIVEESERLRATDGHSLPKNESRLREKIRAYRAAGYATLVSGKLSNGNSVKITDEAAEWLIAHKRSRVPVYNTAQLLDEFNKVAAANGWKPLKSQNTLVQFLSRPEVEIRWKDAQLGDKVSKMIYTRQHSTLLPTLRDALWYGDGTKLNLFYKTFRDGKYVAASLQVYEVIDASSEVLLGYNIAGVENFESMQAAIRNAILFAGYLPVELVYDNQGGTRRADAIAWLSKVAELNRPTAPHNAPSKTIEAIFCRLQSQVLHKYWFFTGGNITDKSERSKPNIDLVESNIQNLPTYDELVSLYPKLRDEWNAMPHPKYAGKSRIEVYRSTVNKRARQLTDAIRRDVFWEMTKSPSTFTNYGLQITVDGSRYQYEVLREDGMPDLDWRARNTGRQFHVNYDPNDMGTVRLMTHDDNYGFRFEAEAKTYITVHRAMQDQTEEERSFIRRSQEENKLDRMRRYMDNQALERRYGVSLEQHGLNSPGLKGVSNKDFERLADKVEVRRMEPKPSEVLPGTEGQVDKAISNTTYDQITAIDRL